MLDAVEIWRSRPDGCAVPQVRSRTSGALRDLGRRNQDHEHLALACCSSWSRSWRVVVEASALTNVACASS